MSKQVKYLSGVLQINIATADPAATHDQLLKAITAATRCALKADEKDRSAIIPLIELLENLLPTEHDLTTIS